MNSYNQIYSAFCRYFHNLSLWSVAIVLCTLASCGNDDEVDLENSIFNQEGAVHQNYFDLWLYKNYTASYNIQVKYHLEDIESDHTYNLAPADFGMSVKLAHIVKYAWLEAYDEVAGMAFTRTYVPKILHLVGSAAYNDNGTMVLGTAEGGLKVTLYMVNNLRITEAYLNQYYFKTMHHEFAHILHQTKNYDTEYDRISEADYISGDWYRVSDTEAYQLGFITPYSMSEPREDIAEVTCMYITQNQAYWDNVYELAGEEGAAKLQQKVSIVKKYMQNSWGIDIDELRNVVQRRMQDVVNGVIDIESL